MLGVSPDSAKSHTKFIEKFTLPFPLLADEDHKIAEAYGVWVEKSMYGKKYMGVERSTFVIGPDGKLSRDLPQGEAGGAHRRGAGGAVTRVISCRSLAPGLRRRLRPIRLRLS